MHEGHAGGTRERPPFEIRIWFSISVSDLIQLRQTWREMENLISGRFIRIFGELLRNLEEIGSFSEERRLRTSFKEIYGPNYMLVSTVLALF